MGTDGGQDEAGGGASVPAVAAVLSASVISYALLQSMVIPSLASFQHEMGSSTSATTWVLTAFLLTSAVCTPILGRLGDMFGRTRVLVVSLGGLIAGAVVAGLAPSIEVLIVGRVLQGAAGAIIPLSFGIIRDVFPRRQVATAIGGVSSLLANGSAAGTALSGTITESLGLRWLFWLPLFALVPTLIAAPVFLPPSSRRPAKRVDVVGAVLLAGWLVSLLLAVSQGPTWGWGSPSVAALAAATVVLFTAWVLVELRTAAPLIDVRLMASRVPARINLAGFACGWAIHSGFAWLPQFVQVPRDTGYGLGASESHASLYVLPWSAGMMLAGLTAGRLAGRFGSRRGLVIGAVTASSAYALLAVVHTSAWPILLTAALLGVGLGQISAAAPTLMVAHVPIDEVGASTGMHANIRTIGGAIGSQVVAVIVASGTTGGRPSEASYVISFAMLAGVCLVAVGAGLALPRTRPHADATGREDADAPAGPAPVAGTGATTPDTPLAGRPA